MAAIDGGAGGLREGHERPEFLFILEGELAPDVMWLAILLAAVAALSGCATTLTSIPPDHALAPGGESVVIGRLTLELMQPPVAFLAALGRMKLTVTNEATGTDYAVWCDLGTLRFQGTNLVGGGRWRVDDESETAIKAFRERYPRLTQPVARPKVEALGSRGPGGWRILKPQ